MSSSGTVQEINQELAQQINAEARGNPLSPYAGKFVGIANGQVVASATNLEDLVHQLSQIEPDPRRTLCLEAGLDYEAVQEIWGSR